MRWGGAAATKRFTWPRSCGGQRYADNCSATSGCTLKAFFCSPEHLAAWRECHDREGVGFRLAPAAALQIGLALFLPLPMPERPADVEFDA